MERSPRSTSPSSAATAVAAGSDRVQAIESSTVPGGRAPAVVVINSENSTSPDRAISSPVVTSLMSAVIRGTSDSWPTAACAAAFSASALLRASVAMPTRMDARKKPTTTAMSATTRTMTVRRRAACRAMRSRYTGGSRSALTGSGAVVLTGMASGVGSAWPGGWPGGGPEGGPAGGAIWGGPPGGGPLGIGAMPGGGGMLGGIGGWPVGTPVALTVPPPARGPRQSPCASRSSARHRRRRSRGRAAATARRRRGRPAGWFRC